MKSVGLSSTKEEDHLFWLALAHIQGLGCASTKKLVEHLGGPKQIFAASEKQLSEVTGIDQRAIRGILGFSGWNQVREDWLRAERAGATLISLADELYPSRLRRIPDPPPVLYAKGSVRENDEKAIAVVGSRSASEYGRRITRHLCRDMASLGFTVVSGMARGIDGVAHAAALEGGGRSVAVLGSGVDVIYPGEHKDLYHRIIQAGAVISELPMGTPPYSYNFPSRNRLISGLCLGVMVVEATEKSGSLITARLALEQGREVFAVPGEAGSSRSRGTHRLIREGAKLVEAVEDIVEEIAPQLLSICKATTTEVRPLPPETAPETRKILELVSVTSRQIDELIEASGLSSAQVAGILLDLEIRGYLKQLPGKRFVAM
jgi:DNA processing protein